MTGNTAGSAHLVLGAAVGEDDSSQLPADL